MFRIGRTARAGKAGLAFTFLLGVQVKYLNLYIWREITVGKTNMKQVFLYYSGEEFPPDGGGSRKPWDTETDCQTKQPEGYGSPI